MRPLPSLFRSWLPPVNRRKRRLARASSIGTLRNLVESDLSQHHCARVKAQQHGFVTRIDADELGAIVKKEREGNRDRPLVSIADPRRVDRAVYDGRDGSDRSRKQHFRKRFSRLRI